VADDETSSQVSVAELQKSWGIPAATDVKQEKAKEATVEREELHKIEKPT